ncbi:MAG: cation transporter [Mogibacterium sp.]|nr:cation transporter [Mogibacterium sp.]
MAENENYRPEQPETAAAGAPAPVNRDRIIVRTSIIGIVANVFLAGFKAAVGTLSGSIAIILDAVNNLSDAMSSIITIIGTKLAAKQPDRKHPYGHGRVEYLSAMIISGLVLYAGITSFVESVKKILHPELPDYSTVTLIIVAVAVLVKILLGRYVKSVGIRVNSGSLVASGQDAMMDSIISASTLVAAIIYIKAGLSLEAWLGAVISIVIMKSGIDMLRETISQILGERIESDLSREIKQTVTSFDGVSGAYDLILHNYGPDRLLGSVHIEVPDTFTAAKIDELTREIQQAVYVKHNVILTGVGIYSRNTTDDNAMEIRSRITKIVMDHEYVLQMHGFYLDETRKTVTFDIVVDFAAPDRQAVYQHICEEVQGLLPEYQVMIALDSDISD